MKNKNQNIYRVLEACALYGFNIMLQGPPITMYVLHIYASTRRVGNLSISNIGSGDWVSRELCATYATPDSSLCHPAVVLMGSSTVQTANVLTGSTI